MSPDAGPSTSTSTPSSSSTAAIGQDVRHTHRSNAPSPVVVCSHRTVHPFFTPTHIAFSDLSAPPSHAPVAEWQSRRARKGRYAPKTATVHWGSPSISTRPEDAVEKEAKVAKEIVGRVKKSGGDLKPGLRMDISWWEAVSFTFGSAVWVINGFLAWFPILRPSLSTPTFTATAAAFAFIGGTVFVIGSYLMVLEALDRGREISFGTAIGELLHHHRQPSSALEDDLKSREKPDHAAKELEGGHERVGVGASDPIYKHDQGGSKKGWLWWGKPMWHDLGYMAAIIQLCAATVFWIATVTGLPGVISGLYNSDGSVAVIDVFYWSPQVVGGSGFITSSIILLLETQRAWYKPNVLDIGWQVGFWNLIGALGFTLCGALGYSSSSKAEYQSALSTFWGSWAFLIGSACQIWEVIWREPR